MHVMQLDNGNSQASLAHASYKPHKQPYIVTMGECAPWKIVQCATIDTLVLWTYVGVITSFNCTVPGIRLSYFSFPCCMILSSSHSIYSILFASQSLCDDVATI